MKTFRQILLIALAVILAIILSCSAIAGSLLWKLHRRTAALEIPYDSVLQECSQPVSAGPQAALTQKVSCGYAVIEMFGTWAGTPVTEEKLAAAHDTVVTSTAQGFVREMNDTFPRFHTDCLSWLPNPDYLRTVHESLAAGMPVPIQWAAPKDGVWTLHYSLVTGMDLSQDQITVQNPYGFTELLTPAEFLSRTGFQAFENMPLWMQMAFALDVFQKNTLFPVTPD